MDEALLGHNHAKSAIDLACWDLFGKSVGLPVYTLLGGSTGKRLPVISSIYAGSPEDMRTRVARHREMGYMGHSIKSARWTEKAGRSWTQTASPPASPTGNRGGSISWLTPMAG